MREGNGLVKKSVQESSGSTLSESSSPVNQRCDSTTVLLLVPQTSVRSARPGGDRRRPDEMLSMEFQE